MRVIELIQRLQLEDPQAETIIEVPEDYYPSYRNYEIECVSNDDGKIKIRRGGYSK